MPDACFITTARDSKGKMQPNDRLKQPSALSQPLCGFAETKFTMLKAGQG